MSAKAHALRLALQFARREIEWWAGEHPCCEGHEAPVLKVIDRVLAMSPEDDREVPRQEARKH